MRTRAIINALVILAATAGAPVLALADDPPAPGQTAESTPARVSYINGEVSFWRPGAQEWAEAKVNTPLAPGDLLYTGQGGTVEIQFGPRAFVRAGNGTQIGLDNQEPDYLQFRVTAGHAGLDLRELPVGHTVEIDTPNAAFTVERPGYYHVDLSQDAATFRTHRGGTATMTPAGGTATPVAANEQIVVTGTEAPSVETGPAPALTDWDKWNYQRTAYLIHPSVTQNVSPAVYGGEELAQHGTWRTVESYGPVWVPTTVTAGWVPYSTGRWIWDPRFGWTWLDDEPWGWAPYHYGRWVFVGSYWAWAPGPVVVRPVYSPALVVFLGGPVSVTVGVRPLNWAPLGWGEPVIPWWGRPGFIGVASWHGWGGPHVVNNVVVTKTTNIQVTNITVYKNVHVTNAVVGVPADRFGHGRVQPVRLDNARVRELTPVRGALDVKPVAASVMPASGAITKPPAAIHERKVIATRAPRDYSPALKAQGLGGSREVPPPAAPQIVPAPKRETGHARTMATTNPGESSGSAEKARRGDPPSASSGPAEKAHRGEPPSARRAAPNVAPAPETAPGVPRFGGRAPEDKARGGDDRPRVPDEKKARAAVPPEPRLGAQSQPGPGHRQNVQPPPPPSHDPTASRQAPPRPQAAQEGGVQHGRPDMKSDPRAKGQGGPHGRGEREQGQAATRDNERPDSRPGR
jgi:hypothetical protein